MKVCEVEYLINRIRDKYLAAKELQKRREENAICGDRSKHENRVCSS